MIKRLYIFAKKIQRIFRGIDEDCQGLEKELTDYLLKVIGKDKLVLEIGSFKGQTSRKLSKRNNKIITIDPFIADANFKLMGEYPEEVGKECIENIKGEDIILFPMTSKKALKL